MSRLKHLSLNIVFILIVIVTSVGGSLVSSTRVEAASDPFCWTGASGTSVEVSCDGSNTSLITNITGSPPQKGKCYEFGFGVSATDYDSSRCEQARRASDSRGPARCMALSSSISTYNQSSFNPLDLQQRPCDDNLAASIRSKNSNFSGFAPGFCYIVANDNSYAANPCTTHATIISSAQQYTDRKIAEGSEGQEPVHKVEGKCTQRPLTRADCPVIDYLMRFISALTALVGVVVVIMIVWGGIKYASAKDNPQEAAKAKETVRNAIIGLVAYFFIFAVLQWLVPGGVL